jgi:hypothetical protein
MATENEWSGLVADRRSNCRHIADSCATYSCTRDSNAYSSARCLRDWPTY